ncbi:MAG TPA: hypothetical protein VFN25_12045 [Dokdonella sp.]|uniref:hypothetical protein n=1 Tax=Dokdonella sp. TaxID=2291710 RepID=UPI002D7F38C5|nr:hypothetical protein [Dokdonella sp.]HET9033627.1 hypothetical protein [Dokdonella sp.]
MISVALVLPGLFQSALRSKELIQENSTVLIYLTLLLFVVLAVAIFALRIRRARLRNFREFAATAGHTLQLESCGGIKAGNLYAYLCALASALHTQAQLRNIELRPGEFKGRHRRNRVGLPAEKRSIEQGGGKSIAAAFCIVPG